MTPQERIAEMSSLARQLQVHIQALNGGMVAIHQHSAPELSIGSMDLVRELTGATPTPPVYNDLLKCWMERVQGEVDGVTVYAWRTVPAPEQAVTA